MKDPIKKILVVSLSNIGDVILTFPVIDVLKRDFPDARLDLFIGPNAETLFKNNPAISKIYVYRKKEPFFDILRGIRQLASEKYDLVVDLRNTAIPFLIFAKYKTPLMLLRPKVEHMREQHLSRLRSVHQFTGVARPAISFAGTPFAVPAGTQGTLEKYAVVAPGSRADNKRWHEHGFAKLADYLIERYGIQIVFAGDDNDVLIIDRIKGMMKSPSVDLAGKLSLSELGYVMSRASLAVVNDSAPLHLASYLNIPVVAFFGPTDPKKYGPWGEKNIVIRKNSTCPACHGDKSRLHNCTQAISFEDAITVLDPWLKETLNGQ